jgi:hypothetical protein
MRDETGLIDVYAGAPHANIPLTEYVSLLLKNMLGKGASRAPSPPGLAGKIIGREVTASRIVGLEGRTEKLKLLAHNLKF